MHDLSTRKKKKKGDRTDIVSDAIFLILFN